MCDRVIDLFRFYLGTPLPAALSTIHSRSRSHSPPLVCLVLRPVLVASYLMRRVVEGGREHGVLVCFWCTRRGDERMNIRVVCITQPFSNTYRKRTVVLPLVLPVEGHPHQPLARRLRDLLHIYFGGVRLLSERRGSCKEHLLIQLHPQTNTKKAPPFSACPGP